MAKRSRREFLSALPVSAGVLRTRSSLLTSQTVNPSNVILRLEDSYSSGVTVSKTANGVGQRRTRWVSQSDPQSRASAFERWTKTSAGYRYEVERREKALERRCSYLDRLPGKRDYKVLDHLGPSPGRAAQRVARSDGASATKVRSLHVWRPTL
jgi:hypothetical protein